MNGLVPEVWRLINACNNNNLHVIAHAQCYCFLSNLYNSGLIRQLLSSRSARRPLATRTGAEEGSCPVCRSHKSRSPKIVKRPSWRGAVRRGGREEGDLHVIAHA